MKCDMLPVDRARGEAGSWTRLDWLLFTHQLCLRAKKYNTPLFKFDVLLSECAALHLSEMDVLCGREVEALLAALMLQQALREAVRHLHVAAIVLLCVQGGVGQHGGSLLHVSRVQE